MKKRKYANILLFILVAGCIMQAGVMTYSMTNDPPQPSQAADTAPHPEQAETAHIVVSQEIRELIQKADPQQYERNITNYETLLKTLEVQTAFQNEIERLLRAGHQLPDLLTAYTFLNNSFGQIGSLEQLSAQKKSGQSWEQIFRAYNTSHPAFVPRSFEPEYLEKLMQSALVNTDDIMLADRVSFVSGQNVKDMIMKRMEGMSWKAINEELGIVNSQSSIPRVQVTKEQIDQYTAAYGLTQQQVVEAFVMAQKLGENAEDMIKKVKAGYNEEKIYAESYGKKYY